MNKNHYSRLDLEKERTKALKLASRKEKRLMVYYGWYKLNKVAKHEGIGVFFINDNVPPRIGRDGVDGVSRFIDVCFKREQTEQEMADCHLQKRIYTVYQILLDDKAIQNSLEAALLENYKADEKQIPASTREEIRLALRNRYLETHPGYVENGYQLTMIF